MGSDRCYCIHVLTSTLDAGSDARVQYSLTEIPREGGTVDFVGVCVLQLVVDLLGHTLMTEKPKLHWVAMKNLKALKHSHLKSLYWLRSEPRCCLQP